jgi:hypothetical protein
VIAAVPAGSASRNSRNCSATGRSSSNRPSSTSRMTSVAVYGLVMEAMRKRVSAVMAGWRGAPALPLVQR